MKKLGCWLCLAALLFALPAGAQAAKLQNIFLTLGPDVPDDFYAQRPPVDALHWWYSSDSETHYLFLPSTAEQENLRLWFRGADSVTIGEYTLRSGDPAPFLTPGSEYTLQTDAETFRLQVLQSHGIPALFLTTESGTLTKIHQSAENRETGTAYLLDADGTSVYHGALTQIKGRGHFTFLNRKKPYQIKLSKSTDLLGMGKAKTWILLADHWDNSLLRNALTFALADAVGLAYTSQARTVDVYINNDYLGTYLLCEKVEIGGSRIVIHNLGKATEAANDELPETYPLFALSNGSHLAKGYQVPVNPPDITGGYLLEFDYMVRYQAQSAGFLTDRGQPVVIKEPKAPSAAQVDYIRAFMQGFENAVFAKDGIDPDTGKHYSEFVDMDSLVKKYLIEEIAKNFDANYSSLYFYKPADAQSTLAFAGPVWDYDFAYGNATKTLANPEELSVSKGSAQSYYLFPALYRHEDFYRALVQSYWADFVPALRVLLGEAQDAAGRLRSIDAYAAEIAASAAMNFTRWRVFNVPGRAITADEDYAENIAYLKNFLQGRLAFLSGAWPQE